MHHLCNLSSIWKIQCKSSAPWRQMLVFTSSSAQMSDINLTCHIMGYVACKFYLCHPWTTTMISSAAHRFQPFYSAWNKCNRVSRMSPRLSCSVKTMASSLVRNILDDWDQIVLHRKPYHPRSLAPSQYAIYITASIMQFSNLTIKIISRIRASNLETSFSTETENPFRVNYTLPQAQDCSSHSLLYRSEHLVLYTSFEQS